LRFLRDVRLGKHVEIGSRVAVLGGGNVALDSARTALRLGAGEVNIYYRRSRDEMPVTELEFDEAVAEGIQMNFLVNPTRIVSENWQVTGLHCVRMRLGALDAGGRRQPMPIADSDFTAEADTVIAAVGQAPDLSFLPADSALERTRWETLVVDSNTLATNVEGVFAGGDFATGPGMVVEAIAAGRRGAMAIDKYLRGDTSPVHMYDTRAEIVEEAVPPAEEEEEDEVWEEKPRLEVPVLSTEQRKRSFEEIELGFSEEQAIEEAKRCLRCDLETI
jgi:NADH-quinone oxidoreductase subunit F